MVSHQEQSTQSWTVLSYQLWRLRHGSIKSILRWWWHILFQFGSTYISLKRYIFRIVHHKNKNTPASLIKWHWMEIEGTSEPSILQYCNRMAATYRNSNWWQKRAQQLRAHHLASFYYLSPLVSFGVQPHYVLGRLHHNTWTSPFLATWNALLASYTGCISVA